MDFFKNIWDYLYEIYLSSDGNYQNIDFEKTPLFSLRLTVLGIFIGSIIACVIMAYNKKVLGGAIRKLLAEEVLSPEKAKTIAELGYAKNFILRNAFRSSVSLRKLVKCVGEEEFIAEQNERREAHQKRRAEGEKLPKFKEIDYIIDFETDRFYIPEDLKYRADVKFEKKGSGWLATVLTIIVLIVAFFVVLLALPTVFGFADGIVGSFDQKNDVVSSAFIRSNFVKFW